MWEHINFTEIYTRYTHAYLKNIKKWHLCSKIDNCLRIEDDHLQHHIFFKGCLITLQFILVGKRVERSRGWAVPSSELLSYKLKNTNVWVEWTFGWEIWGIKTSPPNARVAAMTSMRTNNFKTLRLTNTFHSQNTFE